MTYFHGDEVKFKMADSKKLSFSASSKAEQFLPKFHGLVLGIVGLIDEKGINMTQPIWPPGCPMHSGWKGIFDSFSKMIFK